MTAEARNLAALEAMRGFIARVVPRKVYLKNLVLDGVDDSNLRLWALRANLGLDEESFAARLNLIPDEYRGFERRGTAVSKRFLARVSAVFGVSRRWLACELPILPIPRGRSGKRRKGGQARKGKKVWVHRAASFKAADKFDDDYYLGMGRPARLETMQLLRQIHHKFRKKRKNDRRKRLRRSIKIIQQT